MMGKLFANQFEGCGEEMGFDAKASLDQIVADGFCRGEQPLAFGGQDDAEGPAETQTVNRSALARGAVVQDGFKSRMLKHSTQHGGFTRAEIP